MSGYEQQLMIGTKLMEKRLILGSGGNPQPRPFLTWMYKHWNWYL